MPGFAGLSRREMLTKRAELVKAGRDLVARAEKDGGLKGEDHATWEALDKDVDELSILIEKTPAVDYKEKLAKWDAALDKDPGRISDLTNPNAKPEVAGDVLAQLAKDIGCDLQELESMKPRATPEYQSHFRTFLKTGHVAEALAMKVGEDAKGGVLAPMTWVAQFIKFVDDLVLIRQKATVFKLGTSVSMGAPSWDTDPADSDWTPEIPATDITADDTARLGRRELEPHAHSKLVKMSNKLRRSVPGLESFLISRLGYKFAVTEEKAYLTGNGIQKPLGLFIASDDGISTGRDIETVGSLTTTFDDYIDALMSLKQQYWGRASWLMSRHALKVARKLKDTTNQYLWQPATKDGMPSTILDRPYDISEFVPGQTAAAWTAGVYPIMIGDWSNYWIADSMEQTLQVLNELFSLTKQTGYLMQKETDGMPVLEEAFARIKLKA